MLNFPSFRGATRQLVLWNLGVYFLLLILGVFASGTAAAMQAILVLTPDLVLHHGFVWQLVTYSFVNAGILSTAFALISLWSLGGFLESMYGSRWLLEIYFVSVVGAALCGLVLSLVVPPVMPLYSAWGGIFGLMIVWGVQFGEQETMMFPLPVTFKAKYIVWIWMLVAAAMLFSEMHLFAIAELGGALFGYVYIKFAPKRGFTAAASEGMYGMRNQYYRWKRRQAAKKFEVYMRKRKDN
ncbi:MAG: rhomboid family intramembrane serine protease [Acidobacteriaceae bacterium]